MSRITVTEAAKQFGISRATIYSKIKKNQITKDDNGLIDASDCVRVFGSVKVNKTRQPVNVNVDVTSVELELVKKENLRLVEQINHLQKQLEFAQADQTWLKEKLSQKLIEDKTPQKRGLISRIFN